MSKQGTYMHGKICRYSILFVFKVCTSLLYVKNDKEMINILLTWTSLITVIFHPYLRQIPATEFCNKEN